MTLVLHLYICSCHNKKMSKLLLLNYRPCCTNHWQYGTVIGVRWDGTNIAWKVTRQERSALCCTRATSGASFHGVGNVAVQWPVTFHVISTESRVTNTLG
jgi:hypothetical protein